MKKRFLPIGLFSFIALFLAGFFILSSGTVDKEVNPPTQGAPSIAGAKEYLASIRNNQHTGVLDPKDVISARQEFEAQANFKSSSSKEFTWEELGPDNMGGRTRALIFDDKDPNGNTIYAASVTGGLFKSVNSGSTWNKINKGTPSSCLNVTCMVQADDGTIFVGTGEGLSAENYSAYGQLGYEGGFVGKGIFRSNNSDNFVLVQGTKPVIQEGATEWAYINDLAIGNNKLYAATHTGLKYATLPELTDWTADNRFKLDSAVIHRGIAVDSIVSCDSFEIIDGNIQLYGSTGWEVDIMSNDTINEQSVFSGYVAFAEQGNCYDVKVTSTGTLYTTINGKVYVSENSDPTMLVNRSIYPENADYVRQDNIEWTSSVVIHDKQGNVIYESGHNWNELIDWHTDYQYTDEVMDIEGYPHSEDAGRIEFAVAPSDESVVYAMAARSSSPNVNSLLGIYMTEDNGQTWRMVAPGGSPTLNILGGSYGPSSSPYYQGDYNNTLVVFPNNPYRIIAGGVDLWYGEKINENGFYNWNRKSYAEAAMAGGIFSPYYCHGDHHAYVFKPSNANKLYIGTDGGIFLASISGSEFSFQSINKNYAAAQMYTLDISTRPNQFIGGAQDIGTVHVSGGVASGKNGEDLWRPASFPAVFPDGTDGGSVAFTTLGYTDAGGEDVPSPIFYSKGPNPLNEGLGDRMRRSETLGFDYALDFLAGEISDDRFITPMALWESYNNESSQVDATWVADKDYAAGDPIIVRSNNYRYPFNHTLDQAVTDGDTLMIKDIISNKLIIAVEVEVYMSLNSVDFSGAPDWWLISDDNHAGVAGMPQSLGFSADGNYLWVGTDDGRIFRISNLANAYDENTADVSSSNCIVATTEVMLPGDITQAVTSISVDPKEPNKVLVTLGNYGNQNYVYYCTNGTGDAPQFTSKQANLPKVPVYSGILEMDEGSDMAMLGTEMGVWVSDNIQNGEWYLASADIGKIPVMAVKQRTFYKPKFVISFIDPGTGGATYEIYHEIENYKDIYIATHGRGVFKYDVDAVGIDETFMGQETVNKLEMDVYPNPATTVVSVELNLPDRQDVRINVFDFAGRLIMTRQTGQLPAGIQEVELNISSLQEGTYLMQCTAGQLSGSKKLIVVK